VNTILLTDWLDRLATTTPLATAVVDDEAALTYADLRARVDTLSHALRRCGIRPIDRVALRLPNRIDFVVALFACFRIGAVAVPIVAGRDAEAREQIFRECEPSLILVDEAAVGGDAGAAWVSCGGGALRELSLGECRGCHGEGPWSVDGVSCPAPEDLAVLLYTSGTTARPKGVMHLHGRLARAAARRAAWLGLEVEDRVAALTSLAHAYGLTDGLFSTLSAGATLLLPALDDAAGLVCFLSRQRATVALGTPGVYGSLVSHGARPTGHGADVGRHRPIPSLRRCYSGGGALSEAVQHVFRSCYGREIRQTCGMTELPGYCAVPGNAQNRPGSIGLPNDGIELRLVAVEADGAPGSLREPEPVPTGEVGEIWVRSDVATVGYWNNPAATAALLRDGWIRTGDLARADADGYLYFVGRRETVKRE
jgi:long-chain acyl-CoA synthetase